jgi:enterochelin esterase-like enzyme/outer membrane protein assembly factor BamB
LITGCLLAGIGFAGDWPHYRGPDYNGIAPVQDLLKGKTFGFEVDWIRDIGSGYSSISVVGDTGVVMHSDDTSNLLMAFDVSTGKERWSLVIGPVYKGHSGSHDGPTSTPTVHDGVVYAIDPHGKLVAVSLDEGKKLWAHSLGEDVVARIPHYGISTSPVVIGDSVIVMTGAEEGHAFTAFAAKTGKQLWHSGDDTTTYQSPFVWERNGTKKILALTDHFLMELDPADGRVLWQQEHKITDNESFTPPVMISDDKLLIMHRFMMGAYQLSWNGDVAEMKELWLTKRYPQTYTIPLYYEGHVYFLRGRFITCLSAETGERVWRSRPPGGHAIMMIDGHVIVIADNGELVAVEATPEGYKEKARLAVFDENSFTPVSFANGHLYMRNLKQMARVKVTDTPTIAKVAEAPELKGLIKDLVAKVEQAADKQATVDAFLKQQKQLPIFEDDGLVHFLFRGEVEDIAVVVGDGPDAPMHQVEGTDLYFQTMELDPAGHWEYHFASYDDRILDPLNPMVIGVEPRMRNELCMPNWPVPDFLGEPTGPRGRVESFTFTSELREGERNIEVYLPAGYDSGDSRYPLLLVNGGEGVIKVAKLDVCLDNLIAAGARPVIVVFVPARWPEMMGDQRDSYLSMLTDELVPHLDKSYRTLTDPTTRGMTGVVGGAGISTYATLKRPDFFGKAATQSFIFLGNEELLTQLIAEADKSLDFYIEISSHDLARPTFSAADDSRKLAELLRARGITVKEQAVTGAPGWGSWRAQTGVILEWFTK